jgi:CheY-like chemotaxis protein
MASQLFDVSPWDPQILSGATLLLLLAALVSASIPARRATRVDPMVALRTRLNRLEKDRSSAIVGERARSSTPQSVRAPLSFYVLRRRVARVRGEPAQALTVAMNQPSILLVDDNEDGLDMYQEYLTYRGYRVVLARNGEEAIVQARAHRPDVILLDVRMPGMTGTDAMRALRADSTFQDTPIVALTAHALEAERHEGLAAGFDEWIPKPCLPDQLFLAVDRILSRARKRS